MLDDAAWREAPALGRPGQDLHPRLRQGASPSGPSAYMAYDAENLYFAFQLLRPRRRTRSRPPWPAATRS
ncbi:MAG: hypothetical protein MZV64_43990 [Ignavibacteriales bacterium]|nr:hypothetical protein [Ignavibacteriales bacterium]